jgi:hypothetical protein
MWILVQNLQNNSAKRPGNLGDTPCNSMATAVFFKRDLKDHARYTAIKLRATKDLICI